MRYVSTRGQAPPASLTEALLAGLAPDGGLYVPERIPAWNSEDLPVLASMPLGELGARVLAPFVGTELAAEQLLAIVDDALDFEIPLVEVEPGIYALELFHGPTLAFKDIAARVMARLFAVVHPPGRPLTVLVATSGDTGGAVAHAFAAIPGTRVIVLYPEGLVSPTQEAQLTMFNGGRANVCAYAVSGTFDDCQRLVKRAFADEALRRDTGLTSANSINIGRLLPQMIYYVHGILQLQARDFTPALIATPSGNFGNLTAGVMAKRGGLPIRHFIAATNVNDIVPAYLTTGRFEPRPSIATIANAMDVGNPSNFERLRWMYRDDAGAMRSDITGSVHTDDEVRDAIRRVYDTRGYLLDPHSAIGYLGLKGQDVRVDQVGQAGHVGVFIATAHPAKFREIVEPIIGRKIDAPAPLAAALARTPRVLRLEATETALAGVVRRRLFA